MKNIQLFFGEEKLLMEDAISQIKNRLVSKALAMVNYIAMDGEEVGEREIIEAMTTVPMMSDKKLVVVRDAVFFSSTKGAEASDGFLDFLSSPPEHTVAIFTSKKPDKRRRIYKLFQKLGAVADMSALSPTKRAQWIQRRAKLYALNLDMSTAYYIGEFTGNLTQADSELKKVAAFTLGKTRVKREDVDAIISKSYEANIFKLTDYIGERKCSDAMRVFWELVSRGENDMMVLYMVSKHFMDLASVKALEGEDYTVIRDTLGLHPFVLKKALKQSKNFTLSELGDAVRLCQEADLNIKRGRIEERLGLELLIAKVAGQLR